MASSRHGARFSASTTRSGVAGGTNTEQGRGNTKMENTYRVEPSSDFPIRPVKKVIEDIFQKHLEDKTYNPNESNILAKDLAGSIKSKIKALACPRYKVTVFVVLGQSKGTSINFASRCAWNEKHDRFIEHKYSTGSLFAVALVYGVYQEWVWISMLRGLSSWFKDLPRQNQAFRV